MQRARVLHKKYGGKIFAIGCVASLPQGENYSKILALIAEKNALPEYIEKTASVFHKEYPSEIREGAEKLYTDSYFRYKLKEMISVLHSKNDSALVGSVFDCLHTGLLDDRSLLLAIRVTEENKDGIQFEPQFLEEKNKEKWIAAYTDNQELAKGPKTSVAPFGIKDILTFAKSKGVAGVVINPFWLRFRLPRKMARILLGEHGTECDIEYGTHSVFDMHIQSIVNATTKNLKPIPGTLDARIHEACGCAFEAECKEIGKIETGFADITNGYTLNAQTIIYPVAPTIGIDEDPEALLRSCYRESIELAQLNSIHEIALPLLAVGENGFSKECVVAGMLSVIEKWMDAKPNYEMRIYIAAEDEETCNIVSRMSKMLGIMATRV